MHESNGCNSIYGNIHGEAIATNYSHLLLNGPRSSPKHFSNIIANAHICLNNQLYCTYPRHMINEVSEGTPGSFQLRQHFSWLLNDMYGVITLHLYIYMQLGRKEEVDVVRKKRPWGKLIMNLDGKLLNREDRESESNLRFVALSSITMSPNLQSA